MSNAIELNAHDLEQELRWLAQSLEARDEGPLSLLDPRWDALRTEPRFLELKQRVGL